MTLSEQFTRILEKQQENSFFIFLKNLDKEQKRDLVTHIKMLSKEYLEYHPTTILTIFTYAQKASKTQEKMLKIAAFVCFNFTDYKKQDTYGYIINRDILDKVLDWYCPEWFSTYINEYGNEYIPYQLTYQWVMELADNGFLVPQKELVVKLIPQALFEQNENTHLWQYKLQNLLQRKVTLEEHIWYLFEMESTIHWSGRYMRFNHESKGDELSWIKALKNFSKECKIDRQRLLKEAILATTRNFNKALSGWFVQLFIALEPSTEELLSLQNELFITFNSPHSKPISTTLQYIKKLVEEERFNSHRFLEHVSVLLASETKIIVSSTLLILEKLAKKHPHQRAEICQSICQTFIHREENLQTKAATCIQKYGEPTSEVLQNTLAQYTESMLSNTKSILDSFIPKTKKSDFYPFQHIVYKPDGKLRKENEIEPITHIDGLIFLTSQAFDNNESYHFDILITALVNLQAQITGENIPKLEPAFQRAYQLILGNQQGNTGSLDQMLAIFFIEYGQFLIHEFPIEAKTIKALHEKYTGKEEANKQQWSQYTARITSLQNWKTYYNDTMYEPSKKLLLGVLDKIKAKNTLPLLSTPTHKPGWIAPIELINRISQYQKRGLSPDEMDFQIAISRCAFENTEQALVEAATKLIGEYRELIRFLLVKEARPQGAFHHKSLWMIASLTKNPQIIYEEFSTFSYHKISRNYLTGQFAWKTIKENYTYDQYDYVSRKSVKIQDTRKLLRLDLDSKAKKETGLSSLLKFITPKKEEEPLIYEYIEMKSHYVSVEQNDIRRLVLLTPHNPEPLLAQITHKCLNYPSFGEGSEKKLLTQLLETLLEIWSSFGEMAHLFIATCMLSSDKTIRSFAAEIWIKGVHQNTIHSEVLGEIIGKHERIEFAPLKRLTDLIISTMLQISERHNHSLETMLTSILKQLPEKPINNLKKLLDIYVEILSLNHSGITDLAIVSKLTTWQSISSLAKVVKVLEERTAMETESHLMLI